MDEFGNHVLPNPYDKANEISRIFQWWLNPFLKLGYQRQIKLRDIYNVPVNSSSEKVLEKFQKCKLERKKQNMNNFLNIFWSMYGTEFVFNMVILTLSIVVMFLSQIVLTGNLIRATATQDAEGTTMKYTYAGVMVALNIITSITQCRSFHGLEALSIKMRVINNDLIYRKCLLLSQTSLSKTSAAKILNHMTSDATSFEVFLRRSHQLFFQPAVLVLIVVALWPYINYSVLVGALFFVLVNVVIFLFQFWQTRLRVQTAAATDERLRLTRDVLTGIKVIKMYAWETAFLELINKARRKEINLVFKTVLISAADIAFQLVGQKIAVLLVFYTMIVTDIPLTMEAIFMVILAFNRIFFSSITHAIRDTAATIVSSKRVECASGGLRPQSGNFQIICIMKKEMKKMIVTDIPLTMEAIFMVVLAFNRIFSSSITSAIRDTAATIVSSKRVEVFFNIEEHNRPQEKYGIDINSDCQAGEVRLKNVSASWDLTATSKTLANVSINISPGLFMVVIGEVGSSKTSLLLSIIGELYPNKGKITAQGRLAYAPQEPWIFPASLRKNILLGKPFDKERYTSVIRVSQLYKDFEDFDNGDKTLLGDNGVSVSGGQKARIGLARCIYHEADIYLMDDPLSAVDSEVGTKIFQECLTEFLSKKTRILVTHQTHFIKRTDHILELSKGKSRFSGNYNELVRTSTKLLSLLEKNNCNTEELNKFAIKNVDSDENKKTTEFNFEFSDMNEKDVDVLQGRMKEFQATGNIQGKHYANYVKAGGKWTFVLLMASFTIAQACSTAFDCWMKYWSQDIVKVTQANPTTALNPSNSKTISTAVATLNSKNVLIILVFTVGMIVFTVIRTIAFTIFSKNASLKLHTDMMNGMLRAKMTFFDFNSSGRILNRFAKDLVLCDEILPVLTMECVGRFFMIVCIVVPVVMACYWIALLSFGILAALIIIVIVFLKTSSELKRFEAITRSSIFQHVHACIEGLTTIRTMNLSETFTKEFHMLQDINTSALFMCISVNRWLRMVVSLPCAVYVSLLVVMVTLLDTSPTDLGLALSTGNQVVFSVLTFLFYSAEAVAMVTAVERVSEYTQLDHEADLETKGEIKKEKDIEEWPTEGKIEFEGVSACYDSTDIYSLRKISCNIRPKEKIGIVGRTGAGKSSFLNALFRIIEPQGKILVDGINISTLGLHDLRRKISTIPQDPILFAGSLRMNVDPFGQYPDERILEALTDVQLRSLVDASTDGLSALVASGGSNLSVGQRQLLCLARAILRDNKILVMDEATANVDRKTDELIQNTIRQRFKHCTVLTIAHRLNTIIDSDRIIVLRNGELVEFDVPHVLLQDKEGAFSKLVQQTGTQQSQLLTNTAYQAYLDKNAAN